MDFLKVTEKHKRDGTVEIYPKFILCRSTDLMIRANDFYAIWDEDRKTWSTDEQDAIDMIDKELDKYVEANKERFINRPYQILYLWDTENKMINRWREFCTKQARNYYHDLDAKIIFADQKITKRDFSSHHLSYAMKDIPIPCYEEMASTLYSPEERRKFEWAIGAVIAGDSVDIQKFLVFYGPPGTGKSTILDIIDALFDGYCKSFDSKALGANGGFPLEQFKDNPLVGIQHDGNLSRIEDNTKINSLVSHETMVVNEKHKSIYSMKFRTFLFMGTNNPVRITDARSGLLRRLIDVNPTGNKISRSKYDRLKNKALTDELGGIAYHCLQVYNENPRYYDDYRPISMMGSTNDFYNYVVDSFYIFEKEKVVSLKEAYALYDKYADAANVPHKLSKTLFKEELKSYFNEFYERYTAEDGSRLWNVYIGFKKDIFKEKKSPEVKNEEPKPTSWLQFNCTESLMDKIFADCPAQYAVKMENGNDKPKTTWDLNTVKLKDIDTHKLHYLKPTDEHYITMDFDIPDENGNKSLEKNIEAASKWPPTYAELSKSGCGIHLEYLYPGDVGDLANVYEPHVEIKVFTGGSSLRRKLTKCNDIPIATLNEQLPKKKKKERQVFNEKVFKDEQMLKNFILKAIEVENVNGKLVVKNFNHAHAPNIQFINAKLKEAFESGMSYDVSALMPSVLAFGQASHHQAAECVKMISHMQWKSADKIEMIPVQAYDDTNKFQTYMSKPIAFYDVEVFKNLFVLCYETLDSDDVVSLINPTPEQVKAFVDMYRLVGFNNRRYDNHILYARMNGYSELALYKLSKSIIQEGIGFFGEAYNLSYTDIFDYASEKMSLKKWEIRLGIPHKECDIPWDAEVPEEKFQMVADYCCNDVRATKAVWFATEEDFLAREILADITGMTVNDTTNSLTGRLIFEDDKHPQSEFNWRDMSQGEGCYIPDPIDGTPFDKYTCFDNQGRPIFPDYKYKLGKSSYRDVEEVGEGGRVFARPGIHCNVALLDIASQHPHSAIAENLFGKYTQRFKELVELRVCIKHKDFDKAKTLLGGKAAKYLDDPKKAKKLAKALKIAINSVYGLTSAHFNNLFKDARNVDNIVAKRGALFMINLQHEVEKRGYTVAHIKTDSIKIPDARPEIIKFVMNYGKMYGYTFEHEATYERMCLVNDAVYIAKFAMPEWCEAKYGYIPEENAEMGGQWTATGAQFAEPYVFKTLFSHEPLTFSDYCQTKSVATALYLDFNEGLPDVSDAENVLALRPKIGTFIEHDAETWKPTRREQALLDEYKDISDDGLKDIIEAGHSREFIGKVGLFVPVKPGTGGGELTREKDGKFNSATGAKGYRWKEADTLKCDLATIDESYYKALTDDAINAINNASDNGGCWFGGDFEWFINGEYTEPQYDYMNGSPYPVYPDEIPFH